MSAPRLPMRKIRNVLRLKHDQGLTHRAVAQACSIGVGTVTLYLQRAAALGLGWPLPAELDEAGLRQHVRGQLAGFKVPKRILAVASVGRAVNGKADYAGIQALALERLKD